MKILLLEDKDYKGQEIIQLLQSDNNEVTQKFCVKDAKESIKKNLYDILIVDLNVPMDNNQAPELENGLKMIQYIFETVKDNFYRPKAIFVLTVYYDEKVHELLSTYPIGVINYDSPGAWKHTIKQRLSYYGRMWCDIAIITAVDVEFEAVERWGWTMEDKVKDLVYYSKNIRNAQGQMLRLVLVKQDQMGMVTAANLTDKLIQYFNPRCIIMSGICAGRKGAVQLGDVVIGSRAWDYGSGSIEERKGRGAKQNPIEFIPAPDYISINNEMAVFFQKYRNKIDNFKEKIFKIAQEENDSDLTKLSMDQKNIKNKIHIGAIATGAAVIKNENFTNQFIRGQNKKYTGIDMETYGVYYSAWHSPSKPVFFSVKSVTDVADESKGDEFQKYCALLSAAIVEHYIIEDFGET